MGVAEGSLGDVAEAGKVDGCTAHPARDERDARPQSAGRERCIDGQQLGLVEEWDHRIGLLRVVPRIVPFCIGTADPLNTDPKHRFDRGRGSAGP